ncbi:MAG: type III-B CRISPR module RAMP protein Cmr1 [Aquificae bacterium]|nr:type III-B CRISPR module RAMP protein Cmr1 [Aquificota bacterium]
MIKLTFECEIITPMFMYGGDGRTLELRPSEFKGMLRFWWRALHPDLSLKELKEKENEIFGSTNRKSGFRIVIKPINEIRNTNKNIKHIKFDDKQISLSYLFYSMFLGDNKDKEHFSPNTTFEIIFYFKDKNQVKDILQAFWLLMYLGGLGSRNRRGAGSFIYNRIIDPDNILSLLYFKFRNNFKNINDLKEYLISNLISFGIYPSKEIQDYINFKGFELFLGKRTSRNIWKALQYTQEILKEYEDKNCKKAILGLPRKNIKILKLNKNSKLDVKRSGSPLFFKVFRLNQNEYVLLALLFYKELLPNGFSIDICERTNKDLKEYMKDRYKNLSKYLVSKSLEGIIGVRNG